MQARSLILALCLLIVCACGEAYGKPASAAEKKSIDDLEMQVAALSKLHDLELTTAQLKQLKALAAQVEPAKAPAAGLSSEAYETALSALRDALLSDDDEKIANTQDKVDTQRDQAKLDDAPDPEATDSARKQAPSAVGLLSITQIASYIAANEDDVSDPVEEMMDAYDQLSDKPEAKEFASIRSELVSEVSLMVAGPDKTAQAPIAKKVGDWLDSAHSANPAKLESDRANFERTARQIVGTVDAFRSLRYWMQEEMATLLSNPALPAALDKLISSSSAE